jgi:competence protein ComEC
MILGIEGGIPEKVDDAFKATGTSHLIVISGSNIAFLAGALIAALGSVLSKRRVALAAAPLILIYVLLVGADPPALRAGIMGLLGLGADVLRPPRHGIRLALRSRVSHAGA